MGELSRNLCFLCGSSSAFPNTNQRSSSERLIAKFLTELEQFCGSLNKSSGGSGKSETVNESPATKRAKYNEAFTLETQQGEEEPMRSTCSDCFGSMEGALERKDIVVHVKSSIRVLEENLEKKRWVLNYHSGLLLKKMAEIERKIITSLPSSSIRKYDSSKTFNSKALEIETVEGKGFIWKVIQALKERSNTMDHCDDHHVKIEPPDDQVKVESDDMQIVTEELSVLKRENEETNKEDFGEPVHSPEGSNWSSEEDEDDDDKGNSSCSESKSPEVDSSSDEFLSEKEENEMEKDNAICSQKMSPPRKKKYRRVRVKKRTGSRSIDFLKDIDCTGMPEFKKIIIQRTLKISRRSRIKQKKISLGLTTYKRRDDDHPSRRYWMDYDPEKDELFVENVKILFQDDHPLLQCSQCSFQANWRSPPADKKFERTTEDIMLQHIFKVHLHLFRCPVCCHDSHSYKAHKEHLNRHLNKYTCDICGKPLAKSALPYHRLTHMSEEDKAEAIKAGEKVPRRRMGVKDKSFQCSTCGKNFNSKGNLNAHENRIHKSKEEKGVVICPKCGKQVTEVGYKRNHKYSCGQTGPPVQCLECSRTFKTIKLMQTHMKSMHTAEGQDKSFVCSLCGKAFRSNYCLNQHMKVHSDEKPLSCLKGCGKTFRWDRSMLRHSRVCEGFGTKPGRKTPNSRVQP